MLAGCMADTPSEPRADDDFEAQGLLPPGDGHRPGFGGDGNGDPVLMLERNLISIPVGTGKTIRYVAHDADGSDLTPSVSGDACVTVTSVGNGAFTLTAGCDGTVVARIDQGDRSLEKTLDVRILDPMTMDLGGLQIGYANQFEVRWNDDGTGGHDNADFYHPRTADGWYALGSVIGARRSIDTLHDADAAVVVVRDTGGDALAAPESYRQIWSDRGSGGDNDGSVWLPVCPGGYDALGVVVQRGYGSPSAQDVRCVHERYTAAADFGTLQYTDRGTGAHDDFGAWAVGMPAFLPGGESRMPLPAGTSVACRAHGNQQCEEGRPALHVLMVPKEVTERGSNRDVEPRLTGPEPLDTSVPRVFSSVRVPFTLIPEAMDDPGDVRTAVKHGPFVDVYRVENYKDIRTVDNRQGREPVEQSWRVLVGLSEEHTSSFRELIGMSVTVGGQVSLFGGTNWEVTMTAEMEWQESSTYGSNTEDERSSTFTVPAGAYAQIVQVTTEFQAMRYGAVTPLGALGGGSSIVKYLEYEEGGVI